MYRSKQASSGREVVHWARAVLGTGSKLQQLWQCRAAQQLQPPSSQEMRKTPAAHGKRPAARMARQVQSVEALAPALWLQSVSPHDTCDTDPQKPVLSPPGSPVLREGPDDPVSLEAPHQPRLGQPEPDLQRGEQEKVQRGEEELKEKGAMDCRY